MTPFGSQPGMVVPYFRPAIAAREIEEVVSCLRSGWLTTGPRTRQFEERFAEAVGGKYAVALNSCTAALHLAVEALNLRPGMAVLVPTMTFAATAEIIRYQGAVPVLVDCDPQTLNIDLADAERKLSALRAGSLLPTISASPDAVGVIPVDVGGYMVDPQAMAAFADRHGLWIVGDAAHAFPAAWRGSAQDVWRRCGEATALITCYSFYANKTITTGEGGMAVTDDASLAERMRLMSLHGLSRDAWDRYSGGGSWDYRIVAPGYKYNLTDIAAAIGLVQLERAEEMRCDREAIAHEYLGAFAQVAEIELPPADTNRIHAWHLFPIKLRLEALSIDRNAFIEHLKAAGVGCSVHWRPLHLHPYYEETFGWRAEDCPAATRTWQRVISLPIFSGMTRAERDRVIDIVKQLCARFTQQSIRAEAV